MIVSGAPISADKALEAGLVDEISSDIAEAATALAEAPRLGRRAYAVHAYTRRRAGFCRGTLDRDRGRALEAQKRYPWSEARKRAIDSVANGISMPFNDALLAERKLFETCVASEEAAALFHVFFAERRVPRRRGCRNRPPRATSPRPP